MPIRRRHRWLYPIDWRELSICHRDHDPTNNAPTNLAAWCQRCHIAHDAPEHRRRRAVTVRGRKAMGDLFVGPYQTK